MCCAYSLAIPAGENCALPFCEDTASAVYLSPFRVSDGDCPLPFRCRVTEAVSVEIAVIFVFTFDSFSLLTFENVGECCKSAVSLCRPEQ